MQILYSRRYRMPLWPVIGQPYYGAVDVETGAWYLTLSNHHWLHGWDGGAVVVHVHHLDPHGAGARERGAASVHSLQHQPAVHTQTPWSSTAKELGKIGSVVCQHGQTRQICRFGSALLNGLCSNSYKLFQRPLMHKPAT